MGGASKKVVASRLPTCSQRGSVSGTTQNIFTDMRQVPPVNDLVLRGRGSMGNEQESYQDRRKLDRSDYTDWWGTGTCGELL